MQAWYTFEAAVEFPPSFAVPAILACSNAPLSSTKLGWTLLQALVLHELAESS